MGAGVDEVGAGATVLGSGTTLVVGSATELVDGVDTLGAGATELEYECQEWCPQWWWWTEGRAGAPSVVVVYTMDGAPAVTVSTWVT